LSPAPKEGAEACQSGAEQRQTGRFRNSPRNAGTTANRTDLRDTRLLELDKTGSGSYACGVARQTRHDYFEFSDAFSRRCGNGKVVLTISEVIIEGMIEVISRDDMRASDTVQRVHDEVAERIPRNGDIKLGQQSFARVGIVLDIRLTLGVLK